jgi:hypothetical protein
MAWVDLAAIVLLFTLNLIQFLFWSRKTSELIDKLMCKNYAEYVQTKNLTESAPDKIVLPTIDETEEQEILNELNGMLPR